MGIEHGRIVADGWQLASAWFAAQEPADSITVIVCPEFGFTRQAYTAYAHFLSEEGLDVLTFDYRGVGDSAPASPVQEPRLLDWGQTDLPAAIDEAIRARPGNRIVLITHGLGGLVAGLAGGCTEVAGMLCVAPVNGFFAGLTFMQRRRLWFRYRFIWPFARMLGKAYRLPAALRSQVPDRLARDWAQWVLHPNPPVNHYGVSQQQKLQDWRRPIRCYYFVPDPDTPARTHEVASLYPNAQVEIMRCAHNDLGHAAPGYAGFFDAGTSSPLWGDTVQWFRRVAPPEKSDLIEV